MPSPAALSGVRPPVDPNSILAQVHARLVSRLALQPRASTPANLDPPARSFLPSQPRRERVRYLHTRYTAPTSLLSFNRTPAPTARPSFTRDAVPTYRPSFLRDAIVEQRRLASNKPAAPTGVVRKNKPGKSVRFAEEVTVRPVTRWINEPVKHVHFAPMVEVIPVTRWINASTKSVSFSSLKTVIPITRWIDRREHVSRIPVLRTGFRATHALSNAQIDTTRKVSASRAKPVKHVHFGETTTHTVTRWIEPAVHVSRLPLRTRNYRLTGWSVIPFSKPDRSGEEARYVASWSFRSYATLPRHAPKPGNHEHAPAHSESRLVSGPDILNELPTWSSSTGFTRGRQFGSGDTPCYNHGLPTAYWLKPSHDPRFRSTSSRGASHHTDTTVLLPSFERRRNLITTPTTIPITTFKVYQTLLDSDSDTAHACRHSTPPPPAHRPTTTGLPNHLLGSEGESPFLVPS